MDKIIKNPLVSIVVITYNSSKFVLETLESIKFQTYENIELIISDDFSTDNTVKICQNWLDSNKERFQRSKIITASFNTGTPANCNRGLYKAKGEWVKFIAGDDILDCRFLNEMQNLLAIQKLNIIAGSIYAFEKGIENSTFYWPKFNFPEDLNTQRKNQMVKGFLLAPSIILRRSKLLDLGGFDDSYHVLEDDPLLIKIYEDNNLCKLSSDSVVYYRQHLQSVNSVQARAKYYRKPFFLYDSINFGFKVRLPLLKKNGLYIHYSLYYVIKKLELLIYKRGCKLDSAINIFLKKTITFLSIFYDRIPF